MDHLLKVVKRKLKKVKKDEEGQALTEFAMVAPLLILIAVGVLLLGYFLFAQIIVVTSANQGARAGSALTANEGVSFSEAANRAETTAESALSQGLNVNNSDINVQKNGDEFVVHINYDFDFFVNYDDLSLPGSSTITHTSSYQIWGEEND
ncbi:uncharacterized protein (UPF0333 family) [Salibacterium salarium]|uniref:TadE/TadG family type IV pilus assembly protein n=1 Tax=Salibacterium salarium TaxID=284579 RepID=UPI0027813778|nr:TadE family protein [Salibacterium salarium]MDQ0298881.1 uncharacterized protein (UPF0333 family) [Salibacterium salarium]